MSVKYKITDINTDDAAHHIFDKNLVRHKFGIVCKECGETLEVAYHEKMLYSVLCPGCKKITLVKAQNPAEAAKKSGGRLERVRVAAML